MFSAVFGSDFEKLEDLLYVDNSHVNITEL